MVKINCEKLNLLIDMYRDGYFPDFLVDKIKELMLDFINYLNEEEDKSIEDIQGELDKLTLSINKLEDEFEENNSELETVARESIADSIYLILKAGSIDIDIEQAIRLREW